jgi:hypothetical protein
MFFFGIIIALLAFFLAGAVPIIQAGLVSFVIWLIILFGVTGGFGYHSGWFGPKA